MAQMYRLAACITSTKSNIHALYCNCICIVIVIVVAVICSIASCYQLSVAVLYLNSILFFSFSNPNLSIMSSNRDMAYVMVEQSHPISLLCISNYYLYFEANRKIDSYSYHFLSHHNHSHQSSVIINSVDTPA